MTDKTFSQMDTETVADEPHIEKLKHADKTSTESQYEADRPMKRAPGPGETPPNPTSKNQIKKQKKIANFQLNKKERRLKERERQKQKRREASSMGQPTRVGPSRKELKIRQAAAEKDAEALHIAIDMDYDDLMHERDIAKCVKQCLRIYTINRRSQRPGQLHITGIKRDGHIHTSFKKNDGWENWKLSYHFDQTHAEVFPKEQLVYLTCESDKVLERLDPARIYVIGGLVDHNHQKGLCHERATSMGLETARLPLSENVDMKTRSVLSTFHVFEILLRVSEGKSWSEAILETIPTRKGAKPKPNKIELNDKESNEIAETTRSDSRNILS